MVYLMNLSNQKTKDWILFYSHIKTFSSEFEKLIISSSVVVESLYGTSLSLANILNHWPVRPCTMSYKLNGKRKKSFTVSRNKLSNSTSHDDTRFDKLSKTSDSFFTARHINI
jgi:hypothetical protein